MNRPGLSVLDPALVLDKRYHRPVFAPVGRNRMKLVPLVAALMVPTQIASLAHWLNIRNAARALLPVSPVSWAPKLVIKPVIPGFMYYTS